MEMDVKKLQLAMFAPAAALTLIGIYMAFIWTPTHLTMGDVQRIFYFHVASAWVSYMAFGVTFLAGLLYLKKQDFKYDRIAYASAQLGIVFCTLAITTGPLWGKAVWGVFWRWEDMKLFLTLVLWLIFIAYMALRSNAQSKKKKAQMSAVFGVIGFICIPLSFGANRIWQQYHPTVIATSSGTLQASMGQALGMATIAFTFLYITLLISTYQIEYMKDKLEDIKIEVGERHV
jgi:heme exporter protein C